MNIWHERRRKAANEFAVNEAVGIIRSLRISMFGWHSRLKQDDMVSRYRVCSENWATSVALRSKDG